MGGWEIKSSKSVDLPNTPSDATSVMNTNKLVTRSCNMEVWLFLVDEECVRYPDAFYKIGPNWELLYPWSLPEGQSWILPKLPEVEIQCKVLEWENKQAVKTQQSLEPHAHTDRKIIETERKRETNQVEQIETERTDLC